VTKSGKYSQFEWSLQFNIKITSSLELTEFNYVKVKGGVFADTVGSST